MALPAFSRTRSLTSLLYHDSPLLFIKGTLRLGNGAVQGLVIAVVIMLDRLRKQEKPEGFSCITQIL